VRGRRELAVGILQDLGDKRFTEANPKTTLAFLAALDEACDFITTNKAETAEIFAG
jgi:ABC-type nitrate/sulfonate/bicarbonate transport system substrate-binding protein